MVNLCTEKVQPPPPPFIPVPNGPVSVKMGIQITHCQHCPDWPDPHPDRRGTLRIGQSLSKWGHSCAAPPGRGRPAWRRAGSASGNRSARHGLSKGVTVKTQGGSLENGLC